MTLVPFPPPSGSSVDRMLGRRLSAERRRREWDEDRLAGDLGISVGQLRRFEAGLDRIGAARLCSFSQALEIPLSALFADIVNP